MKLVIFDQDLRINDNPALHYAIKQANLDQEDLVAIYILDEINKRPRGAASKWFLYRILNSLKERLVNDLGCNFYCFSGNSLDILANITSAINISEIYINNNFDPQAKLLINKIENFIQKNNIKFHIKEANLLFNPDDIINGSGQYFKVFTPYWKKCLTKENEVSKPLAIKSLNNKNIDSNHASFFKNNSLALDKLNLLPKINWNDKMENLWEFNEDAILKNFAFFIENKISNYKTNRDYPALSATSKLSPYLHFGVISVRYIFNEVRLYQTANSKLQDKDINHFLSEIGWREFSFNLLHNFKDLSTKNFNSKFDKFPWYNDDKILKKWQFGNTGYPIVDAGMRELYATGWMHNRVRMIVGSFLVKDLLINWRDGEKWFWDCLVDADPASNSASWQWIAGSGADAAPYFRIFNPTLQSQRFDPQGDYIRKWVPEIANLPNNLIHEPSQANIFELEKAGIKIGKHYPEPIIDHQKARDMAMMAFKTL